MCVHTCPEGGKGRPNRLGRSIALGPHIQKVVGVDVCGSTCPMVLMVDSDGMIGVFSYGSTYPKRDRCIPIWLGVLHWHNIYSKGCRGLPTYLGGRILCGSTHVPKVVRVDLAGFINNACAGA